MIYAFDDCELDLRRYELRRDGVWLHLQVGRRLEDGYGTAAPAHAAELAMHFVRGRDTTRAITHLAHAAAASPGGRCRRGTSARPRGRTH